MTSKSQLDRVLGLVSGRLAGPLGWLWSRGFRFLFLLDFFALYTVMITTNLVRFGTEWPTYPTNHYLFGFSIAAGIQLTVNYFSGLYEREPNLGTPPQAPRIMTAMAVGVGLDGLVAVATDRYLMPRVNLVWLFVFGGLSLWLTRVVARYLSQQRRGPARIGLIGERCQRELVLPFLQHTPRVDVLLQCDSINDVTNPATQEAVTEFLFVDSSISHDFLWAAQWRRSAHDLSFFQRVSVRESLLGLRSVTQIGGVPFVRLRTESFSNYQVRLKRLVDLCICVLLIPLVGPIFLAAAIFCVIFIGRPIIFRQIRVGKDGQPFLIFKFRTMTFNKVDTEPSGNGAIEKPRILPSARWMRSTRIDEIPQFLNVLRGEMSIVGPRPETPEITEKILQSSPEFAIRQTVLPGITGLAQVLGRHDTDSVHKLGYDIQYIANWSPLLDIEILIRSVETVLRRGNRKAGETL